MRFAFAGFEHANAFVNIWQANRDRQTFALRALDRKFAAMFAHDAAHNQQPKTGAGRLGRKIRLEHTAQAFRLHAAAGIDELDDHMRIVHVGANAQRTVAMHGFEAVLDHVVKRLLHLIAIHLKHR